MGEGDRGQWPDSTWLQDRAAGCDFHRGNTPCVQHQEPIAVSTPEYAGVLRKCVDDVVDGLALARRIAVVVRDINAVPADEPDTQHKPFHVSHTRRAQRQPAIDARGGSTRHRGVSGRQGRKDRADHLTARSFSTLHRTFRAGPDMYGIEHDREQWRNRAFSR